MVVWVAAVEATDAAEDGVSDFSKHDETDLSEQGRYSILVKSYVRVLWALLTLWSTTASQQFPC